MAKPSLRTLWFCVIAAFGLNVSNYIFMRYWYTDGKSISKYYYPKTESAMEIPRSLLTSEGMPKTISSNCNKTPVSAVSQDIVTKPNKTINGTDNIDLDELKYCPELPPSLGHPYIKEAKPKYSDVKFGGSYQPLYCLARQTAAVIIAHRGNKRLLTTFMLCIHRFLMKQQLDYQIFLVEQSNSSQCFNRGMLLNVGFIEAQKHRKNGWDCIIFHEMYLVPVNSRNLYRCGWYPKQLAFYVDRPDGSSYVTKFGGAIALTPEHYLNTNGFSNKYWGNDADFDDFYKRLLHANYFVENSFPSLGRYKSLEQYSCTVPIKPKCASTLRPLNLLDGLTSLPCKLVTLEAKRMYTHVKINIVEINDTENSKLDKPVTI